jgi:hypothetical protein
VAVDRVAVNQGFGKRMEGIGVVLREIRIVDNNSWMAVGVAGWQMAVTPAVAAVAVSVAEIGSVSGSGGWQWQWQWQRTKWQW